MKISQPIVLTLIAAVSLATILVGCESDSSNGGPGGGSGSGGITGSGGASGSGGNSTSAGGSAGAVTTAAGGTSADAGAPHAASVGPAHVPAPATGCVEMKLYDGDPPNLLPNAPAETVAGNGFIRNVSVPTIRRYPVDESKSKGVAFVVFPGGGYEFVDMETHATALANRLGPLGFAVFGLKYRIQGGASDVDRDSLLDANRAIRFVRSHAAEWGLDENHIGVISYSAGSDLDMRLVAGGFDLGKPTATDPVERKSSRPDFVASMCTWAHGNSTSPYQFTADTPPVYLCHAQDDPSAPIAVSRQIDQQLQALHIIEHLEIYPTGGHDGFHVGDPNASNRSWTDKYLAWLRKNKLIGTNFAGAQEASANVAKNDPYSRVQGENFTAASGASVKTETNAEAKGSAWVQLGKSGDWIKYSKMNFGQGVLSVSLIGDATEDDPACRNVEIWIDGVSAPEGANVVTLPLPQSKGTRPTRVTRRISGTLDGVHDIYVKANGIIHIDYITFVQLGDRGPNWQRFLNDTSWQNVLDVVGTSEEVSYIANPNGGTLQLAVKERPSGNSLGRFNGKDNDVTTHVTWSLDNENMASISPSGLMTAKTAGTVTVTAKARIGDVEKAGSLRITIAKADAKYQDNLPSIAASYQIPEWFRDAKFGLFLHWGIYSVPAYQHEWYPKCMYEDWRDWHVASYGSDFGYKDYLPSFTADKYAPDKWVELFRKAGAKYIVPTAEHHDGFALYDSSFTRWKAPNFGPKRDLIGDLAKEVRKAGLKFGLSNHFAENQWFIPKKPDFDTSNPQFADLYNWNSGGDKHWQDWYNRTTDVVDKYSPEIMYFDVGVGNNRALQKFLTYYYNKADQTKSGAMSQGVVVNSKHNFLDNTIVLDLERAQLPDIRSLAWQTDTKVSLDENWCYIENDRLKKVADILDVLVDIVSKNGNLLLNIGPTRRGEIPDEYRDLLLSIGTWLATNGESIYATRPWGTFGEGPTRVADGRSSEYVVFGENDFRFVRSKDSQTLYITGMKWPASGRHAIVTKLATGSFDLKTLKKMSLLGHGSVTCEQHEDGLHVDLPAKNPNVADYPYVLKLEFDGKIPAFQYKPQVN
jgi:alpha-L-fucosidase